MSPESPKRRPLVAANWKMYKTQSEAEAFLSTFVPSLPADLQADVGDIGPRSTHRPADRGEARSLIPFAA